jgi:UDP-N-acetylmuramoyl-tripeptide--D-alanyl-D-alanine ligase
MMEKWSEIISGRGKQMLNAKMIKAATGARTRLTDDVEFADVATDSREIQPGTLFVALRGEKFDGHDFAVSALEKGAEAVMIDHEIPGTENKCFIVKDTLAGYQQIASAYRMSMKNLRVIAITGSNGKTSTKDMVAALLASKYKVIKTQANFNNEIGLPKTLFLIRPDTEFAVVEMGMRGLGQIREMKKIAHPDAAIITNVGETHLELLGSIENIAKAKSEILENFTDKNFAILNGDDPRVRAMKTGAKVTTYGIDNDCDVRGSNITTDGLLTRFTYTSKVTGNTRDVVLPILGRHNVMNALAAIATAELYGVSDDEIVYALGTVKLTGMRQEILEFGDVTVINDAYNAAPASMKVGLETLTSVVKAHGRGRAIAVLADMLELGQASEEGHRSVGRWAAECGVSELICYGPLCKFMAEEAKTLGVSVHYVADKESAAKVLREVVRPYDVVLCKGSHSMAVDQVIALAFKKDGTAHE